MRKLFIDKINNNNTIIFVNAYIRKASACPDTLNLQNSGLGNGSVFLLLTIHKSIHIDIDIDIVYISDLQTETFGL